jgi:hypothetical protein
MREIGQLRTNLVASTGSVPGREPTPVADPDAHGTDLVESVTPGRLVGRPARYRARVSSDRYEADIAQHVRRLRMRAWRDRARESLLFLPAIMLLGAIVLGLILAEVDAGPTAELPVTFTSPEHGQHAARTIAGATITTAGVVFSLLVVSLQLASGQFSPRVLRGFWRDRLGQVLIGLLLSTFAFSVIALARPDPDAEHAPPFTVLAALLLALASVVAIVVYLDRISRHSTSAGSSPVGWRDAGSSSCRAAADRRIGDPVPPELVGAAVVAPGDGWQ